MQMSSSRHSATLSPTSATPDGLVPHLDRPGKVYFFSRNLKTNVRIIFSQTRPVPNLAALYLGSISHRWPRHLGPVTIRCRGLKHRDPAQRSTLPPADFFRAVLQGTTIARSLNAANSAAPPTAMTAVVTRPRLCLARTTRTAKPRTTSTTRPCPGTTTLSTRSTSPRFFPSWTL